LRGVKRRQQSTLFVATVEHNVQGQFWQHWIFMDCNEGQVKKGKRLQDNVVILLFLDQNLAAFGQFFATANHHFVVWMLLRPQKLFWKV